MNTFDITSEEIRKEKDAMTTKHTPTPWACTEPDGADLDLEITGADGFVVAILDPRESPIDFQNAAFIVRACNERAELVSALDKAYQLIFLIRCEYFQSLEKAVEIMHQYVYKSDPAQKMMEAFDFRVAKKIADIGEALAKAKGE